MSMSDPIADMLTRIRNGQTRFAKHVSMPITKLKLAIAGVLKEAGYISDFSAGVNADGYQQLTITLKYYQGRPVIDELRRVSRPGLRVYTGKDKLPQVLGGFGIAIISTSKGIVSDQKARLLGEGGEVLCYVS